MKLSGGAVFTAGGAPKGCPPGPEKSEATQGNPTQVFSALPLCSLRLRGEKQRRPAGLTRQKAQAARGAAGLEALVGLFLLFGRDHRLTCIATLANPGTSGELGAAAAALLRHGLLERKNSRLLRQEMGIMKVAMIHVWRLVSSSPTGVPFPGRSPARQKRLGCFGATVPHCAPSPSIRRVSNPPGQCPKAVVTLSGERASTFPGGGSRPDPIGELSWF